MMTDSWRQCAWRSAQPSSRMRASLLMLPLVLASLIATAADCARFEPAITQLQGKLILREYPGPPNYQSVAAGDTLERQWILELTSPLCVQADLKSEINAVSQADVREVQLVLLGSSPSLTSHKNRLVQVSGTLFAAHTAHHRTPVLLTVQSVLPEKLPGRTRER
jgi:hypothetical protein